MLVFVFLLIFFAYHDDFYPSKSQIQVVAVRPTPKMVHCGPSLAFDLKSKKCGIILAPGAGMCRGKEMDSLKNKVTTQIKGGTFGLRPNKQHWFLQLLPPRCTIVVHSVFKCFCSDTFQPVWSNFNSPVEPIVH